MIELYYMLSEMVDFTYLPIGPRREAHLKRVICTILNRNMVPGASHPVKSNRAMTPSRGLLMYHYHFGTKDHGQMP